MGGLGSGDHEGFYGLFDEDEDIKDCNRILEFLCFFLLKKCFLLRGSFGVEGEILAKNRFLFKAKAHDASQS